MINSERFPLGQPEETLPKEELPKELTSEKIEDKPSDALVAFKSGLSVFQENHPEEHFWGLLKKDGGLADKGKEFAGMITGYWMKESASYDEFCETLYQVREEGTSYFQSQGQQKEKTVFLAVLQSAESRRANVEEKLTKYNLESKFLGLEAQILPWELARMRQRGREMLAVGPPEVIDAIARTLAIEELAGPVAKTKSNLLETTWRKVGGHLGEIRTALDVTLAKILPGRTIDAGSETPQQALTDLCGAPETEGFNAIVQETGKTAEKLAALEANPGKIDAATIEAPLEEAQPKDLGRRLLDKISSKLPDEFELTLKTKQKIALGIATAGLLVTTVGPLLRPQPVYAETPGREEATVQFEPKSMSDPTMILFEKPQGPTPQYWEKFQAYPTPEGIPYSLNITHGYTHEQLDKMWYITQPSATCRVTTYARAIALLSPEKDINPAELAKMMFPPGTVIKDIKELNRFPLKPELLEPYGVSAKEEILPRDSVESIVNFFVDKLDQGDITAIYPMAVGDYAHTLLVFGVGHEKDKTPYLVLGDNHRGKYVENKSWPYFEKLGFEKVGDFLKLPLLPEKLDEIQKYLPDIATVFSKAEG